MDSFMHYDFYIARIVLAMLVASSPQPVHHANRPSHGVVFMLPGCINTYTFDDGTVIPVKEGDILYLPKHSTYHVAPGQPNTGCYAINFDTAEEITFPPFAVKTKNKTNFLDHFKKAERAWRTKHPGYAVACTIELLSIIRDMQLEYRTDYIDKKKLEILSTALTYMHENYTNELLIITDLSAMCGISSAYFRKLFRQAYGISPVRYVNQMKIARAKELLSSGMYTVTQAAEMSGYTDMSHFSREFKKATGTAPSALLP